MKTFSLLLATLLLGAGTAPTLAQQRVTAVQTRTAPVPDENTLARLVWTTMVTLDNANRTNNYSVLHALGSDSFQRRNTPLALQASFAPLRNNRVDVGRVVLSTPTYYIPPQILPDGSLRLRGGFDFRPNAVRFDMVFVNIGGGWQLSALSVVETDVNAPR